MFKTMIVMTRSADVSQEAFVRWWIGQHARLAVARPGSGESS
jgi:hypothetical protein